MLDPAFLEKITIARYAKSLDDMSQAERDRRLLVLSEFAVYVERDPEFMVSEIFDEETRKYRKRGFYTEKAKAFAAEFDGPRNAQLWRSNVIRAFFSANGRRLLPEQPDWMRSP